MRCFLYLAPLFLTACTIKSADSGDTDTQLNGDSGVDTQADSGPCDTAVANVYHAGDWHTEDTADVPTFASGQFGNVYYDASGAVICDEQGVWTNTGKTPPAGCPDCDWAFDLVISGVTETGPECANLVGSGIDGFDAAWGFSDVYKYQYGNTEIELTDVLWYYSTYGGYMGWYPLAYNYDGYTAVYPDGSGWEFEEFSGYTYYCP